MVTVPAPFGLSDYYLTSLRVGLRSLFGPYPRESLARIINPLSYPRFMEYRLAFDLLGPLHGRVLDIGSPKLPALLLAGAASCQLHVTDIRDYFIGPTTHFLKRIGLGHRLGRTVHLETEDARRLSYEDNFFDRIFSISVLEHIPDDGDSASMREIARVLRPGGAVALTVPFRLRGYHEEFVPGAVYERRAPSGPTFYQRHYDADALRSRLVLPSELQLAEMVFFGEPSVRFERYWNAIPMKWKLPFLWMSPFLAQLFLRRLDGNRLESACGVALLLRKTTTG